jgi:hypothetical protein
VEAGDIDKLADDVPLELTFRQTRRDGWKLSNEQRTAGVNWASRWSPSGPVHSSGLRVPLGGGQTRVSLSLPLVGLLPTAGVSARPAACDRYESRTENGKLFVRALKIRPTA